jgi:hypothetical protein
MGFAIDVTSHPAIAQAGTANTSLTPTPSSRKLQGEDARLAAELDKAIATTLKADRWDEAIARAEELFALRKWVQGQKHFETVSAEWRLNALRRVASMPLADRADFRSAQFMVEEADGLNMKGKFAQAQPLCEKALEIRRRTLGKAHPDTVNSYDILARNFSAQGT